MAVEKKFLLCEVCGNFVGMIDDGNGEMSCCGAPMKILKANTTDGAKEKHVPFLKLEGNKLTVQVGETVHPMTEAHFIKWIAVSQGKKMQRFELCPNTEPCAEFVVETDGTPIVAYEYCNLHGLWKGEM